MGDNIGKVEYQTLPYNAASLTTLWYHVDPKHSVVSSFLCILYVTNFSTNARSRDKVHISCVSPWSIVCYYIWEWPHIIYENMV